MGWKEDHILLDLHALVCLFKTKIQIKALKIFTKNDLPFSYSVLFSSMALMSI